MADMQDVVYRLNLATRLGQSKKTEPQWQGPFVVIEVKSPVLYKIKNRKRELM
jgi:hypothetical protein